MTGMVLVWGLHFIVVKDGFSELDPLTFNALRFIVGFPLILGFAARYQRQQHNLFGLSRADVRLTLLTTVIGPLAYQVFFMLGLDRTTATNTALLVATMPAWTAIFSILTRQVELRRRLLIGIAITLMGVVLVVIGKDSGGVALTRDDLIGSGLVLCAAMAGGVSNVVSKPLVDRVGSMRLAIWKYCITVTALTLLASPSLLAFSADTVPLSRTPHILYSGMLSGVGGFVVMHYGLRVLGPTRASSYFNFNPIVAALAGIIILGEPLTPLLVLGGSLTLVGVVTVRQNTYLRPLRSTHPDADPAPQPDAEAAERAAASGSGPHPTRAR